MKKIQSIIKYGALILLTAFISSCDLEEYNPSGATADAVWTTPEGFETLVNGAYSNLRAQFYGREDIMYFAESGTDIWFNANRRNYLNQVARYEALESSRGQVKNTWERLYVPINLCNAGIERIDDAGFTNQTLKQTREGELRFLRAYYYWHLVEQFGGVHLQTTESKEPVLNATRSSVGEFYEVMIEDAKTAADYLPVTNTELGRATKKSAKGLLARLYLTYASHLRFAENNPSDAQPYYVLARDAAKDVIDNQGSLDVSLYSSPYDIWDPANNKNNQEAMFVVNHSRNTALEVQQNNPNRLFMWYLPAYDQRPGMVRNIEDGRDGSGMLMPTKYLLNLFDEEKDGRYYGSFQEVWYRNNANYTWTATHITEFNKPSEWQGQPLNVAMGDTALYFTKKQIADKATRPYAVVDINDTYLADGTITTQQQRYYFPSLRKYRDPYRIDVNSQAGGMDIIVMRLAEMYLIAAEAEWALGQNGPAASYINVLRTRAAVKTPVDYTQQMQVSAGDINLNFLLDERARELCGEHLRWFDLKRTRQLEHRLGVGKANPDITAFDPSMHYLRPIPITFLNALLNGDEFGQNPNYN